MSLHSKNKGHNKYFQLIKSVRAPASVRCGIMRNVLSHGPGVGGSNLETIKIFFILTYESKKG